MPFLRRDQRLETLADNWRRPGLRHNRLAVQQRGKEFFVGLLRPTRGGAPQRQDRQQIDNDEDDENDENVKGHWPSTLIIAHFDCSLHPLLPQTLTSDDSFRKKGPLHPVLAQVLDIQPILIT